MTLVLDTTPVVALADRSDRMQERVEAVLRDEPGDLVIPAPVCAEVGYLLGHRSARRGDYRVIIRIDEQEDVVLVVRIDHRADVYRP